jgi:hypothetical protein
MPFIFKMAISNQPPPPQEEKKFKKKIKAHPLPLNNE